MPIVPPKLPSFRKAVLSHWFLQQTPDGGLEPVPHNDPKGELKWLGLLPSDSTPESPESIDRGFDHDHFRLCVRQFLLQEITRCHETTPQSSA
jgi:hypothetical protein